VQIAPKIVQDLVHSCTYSTCNVEPLWKLEFTLYTVWHVKARPMIYYMVAPGLKNFTEMFPSSSTCAGYTLSFLGFWLDCRQHKCREVLAVMHACKQNMQELHCMLQKILYLLQCQMRWYIYLTKSCEACACTAVQS
jgi:hypothetical protein